MVKKLRIQVKGNSQYASPTKPSAILCHPTTGKNELCQFPALVPFVGGPIYLREGRHFGPHRGHGFQHIWHEHHCTETDRAQAEKKVFAVILGVLVTGASVHFEGIQDRASISVRNPQGLVIVQQTQDQANNAIYNIVTAFSGQPHGKLIGRF